MEEMLTEVELSKWLGLSHPTLQRFRSNGGGPPFIKLGPRRLVYRKKDVEEWLEKNTHTTTSDYLPK